MVDRHKSGPQRRREKVGYEFTETVKQMAAGAVKGMVLDGTVFSGDSKSHSLRTTIKAAPNPWLTECCA